MDIDWNAELIDQLESHWQNQLRPRLDGLTDEEYFWQPASGVPTIAGRAAHLIDVFGPPEASHFGMQPFDLPPVQYPGTAEGALRRLDKPASRPLSGERQLSALGGS